MVFFNQEEKPAAEYNVKDKESLATMATRQDTAPIDVNVRCSTNDCFCVQTQLILLLGGHANNNKQRWLTIEC